MPRYRRNIGGFTTQPIKTPWRPLSFGLTWGYNSRLVGPETPETLKYNYGEISNG